MLNKLNNIQFKVTNNKTKLVLKILTHLDLILLNIIKVNE
jgi:hypothetical protein